jgi:two-component system, OmpR family, KDP operon response regulator KdpE
MNDEHRGRSILLVEDDPDTRHQIAELLRRHTYEVAEAADGGAAVAAVRAGPPDLILLDLGLPDRDGLTVVEQVRLVGLTPILVLSARNQEADKVAALETGADDYLTKPFGMAELLARISAMFRRVGSNGSITDQAGPDLIRVADLELNSVSHSVRVGSRPVHLTPLEFDVLQVLLAHPGRLVTYGRLLREVWGEPYDEEAHYIHVYVGQIRRKLRTADPEGRLAGLIVAEPGVGYRIQPPA